MKSGSTPRGEPAADSSRPRDKARALFRDGILDAAEEVFAERGFHASRIQDIADSARIAVGTVYNHFEQKDDLLRTLLDERTAELVQRLARAEGDPDDYGERLTMRVARVLEFIERHRSFFVVALECGLLARPANAEMLSVIGHSVAGFERFRAAFRAMVQEGIDAGELVPLDVKHLGPFLGGTLKAFVHDVIADKSAPLVGLAPTIVSLFLHGAARPKTSRPRAGQKRVP